MEDFNLFEVMGKVMIAMLFTFSTLPYILPHMLSAVWASFAVAR